MFSLWRKARRENSAASRLLGSTSLRFALHGWQRWSVQAGHAVFGPPHHVRRLCPHCADLQRRLRGCRRVGNR
ncbi:hypothetical protein, partial [Thiolapillus sp.]|uniref:hypothetical protein n=1 Tax=Thiolapillus sp. TaxID=2017437 RepID=UPI003AF8C5F9